MRNELRKAAAALLLCACLLTGCAAAPPDSLVRSEGNAASLISADTSALQPNTMNAVLYFRYGDTAYLAPEERSIAIQRDETQEKALVRALVEGPGATASSLSPLFPPGTEVLAVSSQGDTLFVTLNEAFLGRYPDEPGEASAEPWKTEAALRRHLCVDSLAATLIEAGLCQQVQLLIHRGSAQSTSMRLQTGFFDRSDDERLLPPFRRNEDALLTPHNAGQLILNAWMGQDWEGLYALVARSRQGDARPAEPSALAAFEEGGVLTGFSLSPGNVSPDGLSAVLSAQLTLRGEGGDVKIADYPLRLTREAGLWKIGYSSLLSLMRAQ